MDPTLVRLVETGDRDDEVAVMVRLAGASSPLPAGARMVSRFGDIATVRVRRDAVKGLRRAAEVRSVKAPRLYRPELVGIEAEAVDASDVDVRRPEGLEPTGRGVVVGLVDWGLDFRHPAFLRPDGSTRVRAIWDQAADFDPALPNRFGYGRIHEMAAIDAALESDDPVAALGYDPSGWDVGGGTHGTATTSIAAGSAWPGGVEGMAPDADIVFVNLAGAEGLGHSVTVGEAIDFVRETADDEPWVVNMSLGRHGGPHDGSTLVEQLLDSAVAGGGGGMIVNSGGNYFSSDVHTSARVERSEVLHVPVRLDESMRDLHEIDVWYPGVDRLMIGLLSPDGRSQALARPDGDVTLTVNGRPVARIQHRTDDPNNGRNQAVLRIRPDAPPGTWQMIVVGADVADGRFHAWIEREALSPGSQARFERDQAVTTTTTGTICNGLGTLAVGAYDLHDAGRPPTRFSSSGDTVDGRRKPNLLAPGERVLVARSRPRGTAEEEAPLSVRMSGTSMAAPFVTGTIACMMEAAGSVPAARVRAALLESAEPFEGEEAVRAGSGYLDARGAVEAVRGGVGEGRLTRRTRPRTESLDGRPAEAVHDTGGVLEAEPVPAYPLAPWSGGGVNRHSPEYVRWYQDTLNRIDSAGLDVDGILGPLTRAAVRRYQARKGLAVDGIVGPNTERALMLDGAVPPPGYDGPPVVPPTPPTPPTPPVPPPVPPVNGNAVERWRGVLGPGSRDGNDVVELVDGPETFRAMHDAILSATGPNHYIYLLGWWLDLDEPLAVPTPPCPPSPRRGPSTVRSLFSAASAAGVQVRAMLWDQTGSAKNTAEVAFVNRLAGGAALLDNHQLAFLIGSQHQKVLIVKGSGGLVAFCGGVDMNCDRICPAGACPPGGAGSTTIAASGSVPTNPGQPLHDVHCRIAGPAAHDLLGVFVKRWFSNPAHVALDRAKGPLLGLSEPVPPPAGPAVVRVGETYNATATMPSGVTTTFRDRTVQEILLAVIGAAQRFIYIEDQYLVGMCAAEAIRRALPSVDHVTILIAASQISDMPRRWELRKRFIDHVRTSPHARKLRVFELCTPPPPGAPRGTPPGHGAHTYVHAKMLIADDEVAVIGSANVNRRGWEHDAEVVAAVVGPGRDGTPVARKLRTRLWAEHLGVPEAAVADPITSKVLWRRSPTTRVCPYDPVAQTDPFAETLIPEDLIDPPMPLATAPCCAIHSPSCPSSAAPLVPVRPERALAGVR